MRSRIELRDELAVLRRARVRMHPQEFRNLKRRLERAACLLEIDAACPAPVTVSVVDLQRMCELHRSWMGLSGPTDVLSLPSARMPGAESVGDIVLCWPWIQIQAQRGAAHNALHEATVLGVHGLLHLQGHDHAEPRQSRRMHQEERRILRALSVPDLPRPYARMRP